MEATLNIGIDYDIYKLGVSQELLWNYKKNPHMAVFGASGSGKTYFSKLVLARIGLHIVNSEIIINDYKADTDFLFAINSPNCYRYSDCILGLNRAVEILKQRQQNTDNDRHPVFFFFDEWMSFLNSQDKKLAESAKQNLSLLLMLGRSFSIHCILSQQRLDAVSFNSSRDNISAVIGLGRLSTQMVDMTFSEYKEILVPNKPQGEGSVVLGNDFYNLIVPKVSNRPKMEEAIISGLNRYS